MLLLLQLEAFCFLPCYLHLPSISKFLTLIGGNEGAANEQVTERGRQGIRRSEAILCVPCSVMTVVNLSYMRYIISLPCGFGLLLQSVLSCCGAE